MQNVPEPWSEWLKEIKEFQIRAKHCCSASTIRSWHQQYTLSTRHQLIISHMLPVGGTVGPPKAESAPGVHGSGSSRVSFTPVPSAASASLAGCRICDLETDSEELLNHDSVLSVQLAYPILQRGTHHPRHVSSPPSFIVLSPHIPLDALGLKITGKRDNRSPNNSALNMLGSSLHTNSVFSHSDASRHLETLQHSEVVSSEQHQLWNWQECWSLAKVRVAFCREQCMTCSLPANCPCVFVLILIIYFYVAAASF